MMIRFVAAVCVVAGLIAIVVVSQWRNEPARVSGFVEADEIRVGSRVGGRVAAVKAQEGETVSAGQVLVELEPYDLLQRQQQAKMNLAEREADYQRLRAGFRPEEIAQAKARYEQFKAQYEKLVAGPRPQEIEAARARVQAAESELELAQENYDRNKRLLEQNAISQAEFDATLKQLNVASATVVMRKKELELLLAGAREEEIREAKFRMEEAEQAWRLAQHGFRSEEIAKAEAARDAAKAALDVVLEQLKELTIRAPIDGTIEALDLQKGDLAIASAPVLSIMDHRHLWVRAYVPQNQYGLVVGQQLAITIDSMPGQRISGRIAFISRQAEFTPSNVQTFEERSKQLFRIKVDLPEDMPNIRPGMTADVWLESSEDQSNPKAGQQ